MVERHKMQALLGRQVVGHAPPGFLEIAAKFNQVRALPVHRRTLFAAIAVGHNDGDRHVESLPGQRDGLPMIATRRGDEPFDSIRMLEKLSA